MRATAQRIRLLSPAVADAIAAGEVIERPASVVKELCENALDAGARHVDVEVSGGGITRIAVVDDGEGIAADELPLAVSRHATSKVSSHHDLEQVATLGFRGEALASIAAVSELRLSSRPRDGEGATIHVRNGSVSEVAPAGVAPGTHVEMCDLFAATPARLRFLRDARVEGSHAAHVVAELALTHPEVGFTCSIEGARTLLTYGGSLRAALGDVLGATTAAQLLEVDGDGEVRVQGFISPPLLHRGTRTGMVLVVNGRRVHNRSLVVAVEEAYSGMLPQHRHPFGVVAITLDPADFDVNVHPTKREVRFRRERVVFAAVQRACWAALHAQPTAPSPLASYAELAGAVTSSLTFADATEGAAGAGSAEAAIATDDAVLPLRAIGQMGGEWIIADAGGALVVVDPHAAHEKVLYVELLSRWHAGPDSGSSQLLLLPEVIDCDAAQIARADDAAAELARFGFELQAFGPGVLRCTAVPSGAGDADVVSLVRDVLDSLEGGSVEVDRRHRLAAVVACHSAVRFGDRLEQGEQQHLLDRLTTTPGARTCPHGRPTMLSLDDAYLRRVFRRPGR